MLKKSVSMVLMALFVFSFIAVAALSADETQQTTGTVMSINVDTGEMIVKDAAGEMKSLVADPKTGLDLKMLKAGDAVSVESDSNGIIKSLEVSK
jgi:ABC-type Fe3+-hydroxamate transport system substrate-binding protein